MIKKLTASIVLCVLALSITACQSDKTVSSSKTQDTTQVETTVNTSGSDVTLDDIVSEYRVSISPLIIGEIYIVGLGIVLVSTIIPSLMIMRYNPKQILMNQN